MKLAGGASTQSRGRRPLPPGAVSAQTLSVQGARERVEFDYSNREHTTTLLSWVGGQSGLLLGGPSPDMPPPIWSAIQRQSVDTHGSYGHAAEHALADALGDALDGLFSSTSLSCRFGLNGKDALDAAARVARAATGRVIIATDGAYHGAGEAFIHPPYPKGIPIDYETVIRHFTWGDVAGMRRCAKYAAAVCVDAPALPDNEVGPFLNEIRKACDEYGTVFILDEVVSGFRFALGGAAEYYGVKPDIACYGKAMSATGCVSAIVGRSELVDLLDGTTFHSLTFGGYPAGCAVAEETIRWLKEHRAEVYGHLRRIGQALKDGFNSLGLTCIGQPERSVLKFKSDADWLAFCSRMIEKGVMVHRPQFPTLAHTMADVEETLAAARGCLR